MAAFLIRSLFRQSSATAMFRRQLTRSVSDAASDGDKSTDNKVTAEATFVLEGEDASDVKALIEVVGRELNVAGVTKAMEDYMLANPGKVMSVRCYPEVSWEGFTEAEEEEILLPAAQQCAKRFTVGDDGVLPEV